MSRSLSFVALVVLLATGCDTPPGEADDGGIIDSGVVVPVDAGVRDAGVSDAGATDAGVIDAGATDAGAVDAGVMDAGIVDAGMPDAGVADAGGVDAGFFFPAQRIDSALLDGGAVRHVLAADVDQDGHLDLIISGTPRAVLFGDGDGGFPTQQLLPTTGVAAMSAIVDVNADGLPDIVTSNSNLSTRPFSLSTNVGARQFSTVGGASAGPTTVLAPLGRGDGGVEFVFQSGGSSGVLHHTVLPDGGWFASGPTLEPASTYEGDPNLAVFDFTGDGQRDLVLIRPATPNTQMVYLAKEDGGFVERARFPVPFQTDQWTYQQNVIEPSGALLALGWETAPMTGLSLQRIFRAQSDGGFDTAFAYPYTLSSSLALALADFEGDGVPELLLTRGSGVDPSPGGDLLVLGNDGGTYVELDRASSLPRNANTMAVGDFNEDGRLDVVVGFYQEQPLMLLRGR